MESLADVGVAHRLARSGVWRAGGGVPLGTGRRLGKHESRSCGVDRNVQSQHACLAFCRLQHHLTDDGCTWPYGAVLKEGLRRLYIIARGFCQLVNAYSGRGANGNAGEYTGSGIVGLDRAAGPKLVMADLTVA